MCLFNYHQPLPPESSNWHGKPINNKYVEWISDFMNTLKGEFKSNQKEYNTPVILKFGEYQ